MAGAPRLESGLAMGPLTGKTAVGLCGPASPYAAACPAHTGAACERIFFHRAS